MLGKNNNKAQINMPPRKKTTVEKMATDQQRELIQCVIRRAVAHSGIQYAELRDTKQRCSHTALTRRAIGFVLISQGISAQQVGEVFGASREGCHRHNDSAIKLYATSPQFRAMCDFYRGGNKENNDTGVIVTSQKIEL